MPFYLDTDTWAQAQGDLFQQQGEQQVRNAAADQFVQHATAAMPSMVDEANQAQQQAQQQREQAAQDFTQQALAHIGSGIDQPQAPAAQTPDQTQPAPPPDNLTPPASMVSQPQAQRSLSPAPQTQTASPTGPLVDYARQAASNAGIDPDQFVAQINQESRFDPNAGSPAGARGIAQIVPKYHPGVDPTDPYASLNYAANLMANLKKQYGNDQDALVAYNGGQGAVNAWHAGQPYGESQDYVNKILGGQPASSAPQNQQDWTSLAYAQLNKPYIWGSGSGAGGRGTGDVNPQTGTPNGFDCSGFVSWVLKNGMGIDLPAQTASAYGQTAAVSAKDARPGDVVFYNMDRDDPHDQHMGLYLGDDRIVEAGGVARNVNIADLNANGTPEFRRPIGAGDAQGATNFVGHALQAGQDLASNVSQGVSNFVGQTAQDLTGFLTQLGREPTDSELSRFLASRAQDVGNAAQGVGGAIMAAGQNPAQNGPIGAFNAGLRGLGQAISPSVDALMAPPPGALEGRPLSTALNAAGQATAGVPVLGGALQFAGAATNAPGPLEAMDIRQRLAEKYGTGPLHLDVDVDKMSPEDRAAWINSIMAVGGMTGAVSGGQALTGTGILQKAMSQLDQYPARARGEIDALVAKLQADNAPASTIGAQIQRWMSKNPIEQFAPAADATAPTLGHDVASTLRPGSGPLAPAAPPQDSTDALQGFVNMAKAQGKDTSALEDQLATLRSKPAAEAPSNVAAPAVDGGTPPRPPSTPPTTSATPGDGLPPNEWTPTGPQPGQFSMFSDDLLPMGGPRPTGTEYVPGGAMEGQLRLDGDPLPVGGPRPPAGADAPTPGVMEGQHYLFSGDALPVGGPRPTGPNEALPTGPMAGQQALPGFPHNAPVDGRDIFNLYRMGNLISAPATVVKVALNSLAAPVWTLGRDAATLGRGAPQTIAPEFQAAWGSLGQAGAAFLDALTKGTANAAGGLPTNVSARLEPGLGKTLAQAWELPGNLHGALQSWASTIVQQAEVGRMAALKASAKGLTGQDWWGYVDNLVKNPTPDIMQAAQQAGDRASLRGNLGTIGSGIVDFRNSLNAPGANGLQKTAGFLGNVIAPILKIPLNDLTQSIEKSPLGLVGTGFDVARAAMKQGPYATEAGFAGNGVVSPLSERLANNVVGSAVTAFLVGKAMDGNITGSGPDDPQQRKLLMKQGWQPNSVNVPGVGWVSWQTLPPGIKEPMLIAGNFADMQRYGSPDQDSAARVGNGLMRLVEQFGDAPGLQEAGQIYDLLKGGATGANGFDRAVSRFGAQQLDSLVPGAGLVKNVATATDDSAREVPKGGIPDMTRDYLAMDLPGARETLPAKQDLIGQPMTNPNAGLGALIPRVGAGTQSATGQVLGMTGLTLSTPSHLSYAGRTIPLSPDDQQVYERARGQVLEPIMQQLADNPRFASAPREAQDRIVRTYISQADRVAEATVLRSLGTDQVASRVAAAPVAGASVKPSVSLPGAPEVAAPSMTQRMETVRQQMMSDPRYASMPADQQEQMVMQMAAMRR